MVEDDPIYRLLDIPERLEAAESIADTGQIKGDVVWFESAFKVLEDGWADLLKADKRLSDDYSLNLTEEVEPAEITYSANLDRLDQESHPAAIGLALPKYFEMLKETESYLIEKFEDIDAEPTVNQYSSGGMLPKESKDF